MGIEELAEITADLVAANERAKRAERERDEARAPRGNFLWPFDEDSDDPEQQIRAHGYEVINGRTEEYIKLHWDALIEVIAKERDEARAQLRVCAEALDVIRRVACGEDQVANDDSEGLRWVWGKAKQALAAIPAELREPMRMAQ